MMTSNNPSTSRYLQQIKDYQQFTQQEEMQLIAQMRQSDSAARELLIKAYLTLVVSIACMHQRPGIELDDLIQEGNIGLIEAIDRFNPLLGNKLNTYAVWRIKKKISQYIQSLGSTQESLDTPICVEDEDYVFLADMIVDKETLCGSQAIKSIEETMIQVEEICRLYDKLDSLSIRQRKLVMMLYGLGEEQEHSIDEMAEILGISRKRVEQLRDKALRRLS